MDDEVDDGVGVLVGGEGAEDVADDFHNAGKGQGGEVPRAVPEKLEGVEEGGDCEEDDGKDGEGEVRGVAVAEEVSTCYQDLETMRAILYVKNVPIDNDPRVVRAMRIGEIRISEASACWSAHGN